MNTVMGEIFGVDAMLGDEDRGMEGLREVGLEKYRLKYEDRRLPSFANLDLSLPGVI